MSNHPAHAFPPGEYLRDELEERGWTVTEFAEIIGRPIQAVSEILNAKKEITTATAMALSEITANEQASAWLFPGRLKMRSTSVPEIVQAATGHGVHPSVVIGQVQRLTDNWSLHRAHIPKVRPALQDTGLLS